MLWLLVRAGIYILLLAGVTYGIGVLIDTPGRIEIMWGGRAWEFRPLTFVALFLAASAALYVLYKLVSLLLALLRFAAGDDTAFSRFVGRSRIRRGLDALSDALLALEEGDGKRAMAKTARAGRLLDRPDLAHLVGAQAAQAAGARGQAEEHYRALARSERTQAVGVRGLLTQAAESGDAARARKLAERAFALRPRDQEVMGKLFDLQTGEGDWAAARRTLSAEVKAGMLPREVGARRDAVLALAEARAALEAGDAAKARDAAMEAHRRAPALAPAAAAAAQALGAEGERGRGERVLRKTWRLAPHPDVAAAYAALSPDETPDERRDRFRALIDENRDHRESRLLSAELALAAEDFPAARAALGDLAETSPTTRSLAIMAAVERGSGADDKVVRAWLAKALSAPRGEAWVCDVCGTVAEDWTPVCAECGAVDSLTWKQPEGSGENRAVEAALLPVILGSLEGPQGRAAGRGDVEDAEPAGGAPA
ncbi:MAG: heme biosynthesis HemY N-terminal domain-containing protein [Pseudomonadota bacterium]